MLPRYLGFFILAVCTTILSVYSGAIGCAGPVDDDAAVMTNEFPETCAEVQENAVDETGARPEDGTYTLYIDGDESLPWDAYCHNMRRSDPAEYLTVTEDDNYSQIRNNDFIAETTYRRLRIDPITLEINPLDDTFATSDFDSFEPELPVDGMEFIPLGWAEIQPTSFNMNEAGEANVSLAGTPFIFDESILDGDLTVFFCQVDSEQANPAYTIGTGAEVESDLTSFHLTAINNNSEGVMSGISTREVADCDNLGTGATDFSSGAFPLVYNP